MTDGPKPGQDGHIFAAIDIAAFQPVAEFKRRVDMISREIQGSRRRAGVERLYLPGLLEAEFERRYAIEGIPLNDETLAGIRDAAKRNVAPFISSHSPIPVIHARTLFMSEDTSVSRVLLLANSMMERWRLWCPRTCSGSNRFRAVDWKSSKAPLKTYLSSAKHRTACGRSSLVATDYAYG